MKYATKTYGPRRQASLEACRKKFLYFFPDGFRDQNYLAWERDYKWEAHRRWTAELGPDQLRALLDRGDFAAAAKAAVRIESRTNLLFSFEKMALRDAVASAEGARLFAVGLYEWLYGSGSEASRFDTWCATVASLPRRQTRVLTWPAATVFGFIARPKVHFFVKPMVTKAATAACDLEFRYRSKPDSETYADVLAMARAVRAELADMGPRDMIDIQSFLWVQGSDEYE
ncbi:MAG: hypothetical protein JOZ37_00350 [Actinobacteria bacterium]|nr:hypothetical protein [Actinomycetota bacterium]MBV9933415.1 hypothetical protein [Actinomycetota bacterium]